MKWGQKRLGDFCSLVNGKAYSADDWSESGLPIIRIQNLNDSTKPFNYWPNGRDRQVHVRNRDLLIAWSGTPGTSFGAHIWKGPEGVLNQHIFRVDLTNGAVTKEWLRFCVNIQLMHLIDKAHGGVGLKHVTKGAVEGVEIPLPPLAEQKRIAGILDAADALRAKRREALAQLDSLLQAAFLDLFGDPVGNGWAMATVEHVASQEPGSMRTGPFGSQLLHSEFVDEGIRVLGIDNAVANEFREGEPRYITAKKYAQLRRYTVKPGDVLITIMGTCGRCAIVPEQVGIAINTKHLCCITLDQSKCLPAFMHAYFLQHPTAREYLSSNAKGAIMSGLNMGIIKKLPIPIPPLQLQQRFTAIVSSIKQQKDANVRYVAELDTLFASLQSRAFRGEL